MRQRRRKLKSMADHQVTSVMPHSGINNIDISDHDEDHELNELEKLAGIRTAGVSRAYDDQRTNLDLEISDNESQDAGYDAET